MTDAPHLAGLLPEPGSCLERSAGASPGFLLGAAPCTGASSAAFTASRRAAALYFTPTGTWSWCTSTSALADRRLATSRRAAAR